MTKGRFGRRRKTEGKSDLREGEHIAVGKQKIMRGAGFIGCLVIITAVCWMSSFARADERVKVIVSICPQKYFLKKIGGDLVDVSAMVLPGGSPHTYEPKPQQMVALTKAKLYFAVGLPFEDVWLKKFADANPRMVIIHTDAGIAKLSMDETQHHDLENEGHSEGKDPHIWLSPALVMLQARQILVGLLDADPDHAQVYMTNYKAFITELVDLDLKIKDIFSRKTRGAAFMVFHPSWGYFAKAYDLRQIPVEVEGREPSPKDLANIVRDAKEMRVKVIFVQPQISAKSASVIAKEVGCRVMTADPLAEDWSQNLLQAAEDFAGAL